MALPRILLLTDVAPRANGGGGAVYLHAQCSMYSLEDLSLCLLEQPGGSAPDLAIRYEYVAIPPQKGYGARLPRILTRCYRWLVEMTIEAFIIPGVVRQIVEFATKSGTDRLWVPLNCPHAIRLAGRVARKLGVPLLVTVMDPPEYKLPRFGLHGSLLRKFLKTFYTTLGQASCCAVQSEEMKRRYEARAGVRCVVVNHGIHQRYWRQPKPRPHSRRFIIGFAGSIYAHKEWESLIAALSKVGWRVAGRRVLLRLMTDRVTLECLGAADIQYYGWRSFEETLSLLAEGDVCYLPYWIDDRYAEVVQTAFPSKLSLYLATGLPVFFHGPLDSSPMRFFDAYPVGVSCSSREPRSILEALELLASDDKLYSKSTRCSREALENVLGFHVSRQRFAEFVGAERSSWDHLSLESDLELERSEPQTTRKVLKDCTETT